MSYTVLARKYRPQTFADLAGQEHVTRTLGNALTSGRVAHAFLFTGVRGVGKTTTARILAKALNCEKGPTPEPCSTCAACTEIASGVDLDVLEIDGASNNSVEDVRRLQETIPFRPARDRFKIVIVDEVHMLSTGAFNAFLKTLEEPPPHVKFIFATTESHKVPITIRSRCQRYDFRLIPQGVVAARVREILAKEGLEADDAAVALVSREAAGSMRDALTLLDQIVAFSSGKLVGEDVAKGLGIADREALFAIATAILDGDGAAVLAAIDALAQRGLDLFHFAKALVDLLRDLVVLRVSGEATDLVSLVEEERKRAFALAKRTEPLELQRAFHAASLLVEEIGKSTQPKIALEMGLVRIATRPPLRAIGDVLARLEELERRLGSGGPGGGSGGASPGGGSRGTGRSEGGGARAAGLGGPAALSPSVGGAPSGGAALAQAEAVPPAAASPRAEATAAPSAALAQGEAVSAAPPRADAAPGAARAQAEALPASAAAPPPDAALERAVDRSAASPRPAPSSPVAARAASSPAAARLEPRAAHEATGPGVRQAPAGRGDSVRPRPGTTGPELAGAAAPSAATMATWASIVAALAETRPPIGAILLHAVPVEVSAARILIAFPPGSFYVSQAKSPEARAALADTAERALGGRPEIEVREESADGSSPVTLAAVEDERQRARFEATRKKALNHPMVLEALALFEAAGKHVEVRVEDGN